MSRWTKWKKIADKKTNYGTELDNDGPANYEIGIKKPSQREVRIKYTGETKNERERMIQYGRNGSHIPDKIDKALKDGNEIYYRGQAKPSKEKAEKSEKRLLKKWDYPWNTKNNK